LRRTVTEPRGIRPARRSPTRAVRSALAVLGALGLLVIGALPALAVPGLEMSTPYPAVAVAPDTTVNFDLTIDVTERRQVALEVTGVPTGWEAALRGGGNVVDGVEATPDESPEVRLDVTVPAEATADTYDLEVVARSGGLVETLPISIRVNPTAAGSVEMTTDFPTLTGPSTSTFRFSLTLQNDTAGDLTFALTTQAPAGWTVTASPASQAQAASATVEAGASETISVEANPADNAPAGQYPITVRADAGSQSVESQLGVEITGSYAMVLTTPDGRLNTSGNAGSPSTLVLRLQNDGTAPLAAVAPSVTAPTDWTVTFAPETVDIPAGQQVDVTATITPAGNAVAGDYVITFRASAADNQATADANVRFTVETSLLWAVVGVALIVATLAALGWVFAKYGRR
jgi:uncharacterized membrane protein